MNELVALHTQALVEPVVSTYLGLLRRALRAARLNNSYPDRRRLQSSLGAMDQDFHRGLYDNLYIDARTGLPNMASFTRVLTDQEVSRESIKRMGDKAALEAKRGEAAVYERLARKRRYFEKLGLLNLAPIDEHRVQLRRHDPSSGTAMFRLDLTKLDATGLYIRVTIELTQVASVWRSHVIDLDEAGETAEASEAFHATIYRYAAFDAESLFIQMHDIEGVSVDRVQRGVIGPALYAVPAGSNVARPMEIPENPLKVGWNHWLEHHPPTKGPEMVISFQSDVAARDVREEKNNDPLSKLLGEGITKGERARYDETRRRFPFKVYKDRKFVCTAGVRPVVQAVCESAETKNLIYPLR
jgi:hypothetical protein